KSKGLRAKSKELRAKNKGQREAGLVPVSSLPFALSYLSHGFDLRATRECLCASPQRFRERHRSCGTQRRLLSSLIDQRNSQRVPDHSIHHACLPDEKPRRWFLCKLRLFPNRL